MYIKIHRGTEHIGGNVIEVGTENTKIVFDCGAMLPPIDDNAFVDDFELVGLTKGVVGYDGVFLSHHHGDHCGLLSKVMPSIPVYTGEETKRILNVVADFIGAEPVGISNGFVDGQPILIKDIKVTPIMVDHSAKDAYMFLIESNGKSVLYTGDYRNTVEVQKRVKALLGDRQLDLMISEGTNINAKRTYMKTESELANEVTELMKSYNGTVFVLCSTANEERVNVMIECAKKTERVVCEDLFMTTIRNGLDKGVQSFQANIVTKERNPRAYKYFDELYKKRKLVGGGTLAGLPNKKLIFVRTSMVDFMKRYLNNRPEDAKGEKNLLIYSMWNGYKKSKGVEKMLKFCEDYNIDVVDFHCSGHAYNTEIKSFIEAVNPKILVPIHCEKNDREKFLDIHNNCLNITDGEVLEI